jgi:PKD repeat protein
MKKFTFICLFTLAGLFAFSQYSPINVSGTVKDVNGNPIAYYPVMIYADSSMGGWFYNNTVNTDSFGVFNVTITPPVGIAQGFAAYTYDCNKNILDTFFTNATNKINLNFTICIYTPPSCLADFYFYPDSSGIYTLNFFDKSIGSPTSYYWSFGDSTFSTLKNPVHTFVRGSYNVCLTISNTSTGCYDTYCTQVYIDDSSQTNKCSSYFKYLDSNLTVNFYGYSQTNYSRVIGYTWDFGDGTTGTGQNPVHTYSTAAQYFVTLVTAVVDSLNDTCVSKFYDNVYLGQLNGGTIYGTISSKTYSVDKALVYLIQYNLKDSTLTAVDSVYAMDSSGTSFYYFGNVPDGDYLVKAALTASSTNYVQCLPTYYGNVLFWDQATTVTLNKLNQYAYADIEMVTGVNTSGPGFIGGKTSKGANIWIMNPGVPMGNVEILLLDQSGNPVSYDFSLKTTGDFEFSSLALGTYQVYAEMPGRKTIPVFVTIDAEHPIVNNVQIVINEKNIKASVNQDISASISTIGGIYPNPVQGKLNLDINIKKAVEIDLQIINNLGQVISTSHNKLTTGKNIISSDTRNLSQGIYILNIKSSDGANIFKNFTLIK